MRRGYLLALIAGSMLAQTDVHPTGSRITPPIVNAVAPQGVARGTTTEITVEGLNLAGANAIHFSEPGIKGRIVRVKELPDLAEVRLGANGTASTVDLGPLPPRNQVTIELEVEPGADAGPVKFRLLTPLGTTGEGAMLIEPYYGEAADREPNDTLENAFETYLPSILAGAISKPGDVDHYKIQVKAGEELVFENGAMQLGSSLSPVVAIVNEGGAVLKEWGADNPANAATFSYKFEKAGTYYVRVSDFQRSGRASHVYRYKVGRFPVATSAYPLGMRRGASGNVSLAGYGLGDAKLALKGEPSNADEPAILVRPKIGSNKSIRPVKLALDDDPEVESNGVNGTIAAAQAVTLPVIVNGRVGQPKATSYFRFSAKKGQSFVFEVKARRLESELDSEIEVLDAQGRPIERAVARAVSETFIVLRDHDSESRGMRIQSWNHFAVGDYLMVGSEIVRIEALPRGPDDDFQCESFGGKRIAWFGTSGESHAVDKPVYKVQMHPAGARFASNGLPLTRLYFRNDDGGPAFGKDSYLQFTAPADGEYFLRLRDVRGDGSERHAYRLSMRAPRPDFSLAVDPKNPNVPRGGAIPVTVTALRLDDFDGPIAVSLEGLPAGLSATKGVIGKGQMSATLLLSASDNARLEKAAPFRAIGRAQIQGREVTHLANPEDNMKLVALMPQADIRVTAETPEVILEPGGKAEVTVSVKRERDFGGRVPVEVRNLPPRVLVLDVGLNGVLFNEDETRRTFTIVALNNAEPVEQLIYVSGKVETRSPLQTSYAAPQAIRLIVRPKSVAAKN